MAATKKNYLSSGMKTFCTILFFLSLTFFSFDALVNSAFYPDIFISSLSDPAENSQNHGHLLNVDHENNDQICNYGMFDNSPGKGIIILFFRATFYYFTGSQFTWHPPEKL
jgi:hypothetical protein